MEAWAVPLAALIVSLSTLIFGTISLNRKAAGNQVQAIETRLNLQGGELVRLNAQLAECHRERTALQRENIELMRRLVHPEQ